MLILKIGLEKCCASTISWKIWHAASNKNKFLMPNNELILYPNKLTSCPNKLFGYEVSLFLLLTEDKWATKVASFPGPAQLSVACSHSVLQVTESWAGPGNEATTKAVQQNTDIFCINQRVIDAQYALRSGCSESPLSTRCWVNWRTPFSDAVTTPQAWKWR